jgi:SAM-dependent methyltransferase
MHYDPIKRSLGDLFNRSTFLRKTFYKLLDLLLLRAWHIQRELKEFEKTHKGPVEVLDAGMGFGQYSFFMGKRNPSWKILAVDVKQEQVNDCSAFFKRAGVNNVEFQLADLTKFQSKDRFDLVLCVDVMEHILEDVEVFKNFHASMKKGGMVLISTPSDQGGSDVSEEGESSFIEEHVRDGYNADEIKQKMISAGFSKVDVQYSYGTPGKISWRLSMKYPIQMLGLSKAFFIILPFYYILTYPFSYVLNYFDSSSKHETGTGLIVKAWK